MNAPDTQPLSPFEAGILLHDLKRDENDIDLVPTVRDILTKVGLAEDAVAQCYDGNRHVQAAINRKPVVQMRSLNRFLELSLQTSAKPTQGLRAALLPNATVPQWLDVVENKVAPFIKENNLLG